MIKKMNGNLKFLAFQVRNINGNYITVTRSMKTSIKKSKLSFETLDATINVEADGKEMALSKRCADVNSEMCLAMGVSKAILNNVIFCHQEDSSWPLDEQKKLKEKFDAIFGTTEYNKAIDKLMKIKKEYNVRKLLNEGDLKVYHVNKNDAEKKKLDLENTTEKLNKLDGITIQLDQEMLPIKEKLEEIRKVEMDVSKCVAQRVEIKTKLKNCQDQQENLKSKIKTVQTEKTSDELKDEIEKFKDQVLEKKNSLRKNEKVYEKLSTDESKLQSEINNLKSKSGTLLYKREMEQELAAARAKKVQKLCKDLQIVVNDDLENNSDSLGPIFEEIKEAFKKEESTVSNLSKEHEKKDEAYQCQIDGLREKIATVESEIATKKSQVKQAQKDEVKIQSEVEEIENSARMLKKLSADLEKIEKEYSSFQGQVNMDEMQAELDEKKSAKNKLETQMEKLDDEIHFLNSIENLTNKIRMKEQQLEEKQSEVERLRNKNQPGLKSVFGDKKLQSNYRRSVLSIQDDLKSDKKRMVEDLKKMQMKFAALQSNRKNQMESVKRVKSEVLELEEKIYEHCGSTEFEEVVERMKETLDKTQLEFGAVKSSEALYKKYMSDLKDHPGCPLCHKQMNQKEQSDLSTELHDEILSLPNKISKMEKELKKERNKYDNLLSLKPSVQRLEKLKASISAEDVKLKNFDKNIKDIQAEIDDLETNLKDPDTKLEIISAMIGDMTVLDEGIKAIEKLKIEMEDLQSKVPKREMKMSLEDAQLEKSTLLSEVKTLRCEIDRQEKELNTNRKRFNEICERRNQTKAKQLKLQEGVQALSQLKERLQEIKNQLKALALEISENESVMRPTKDELVNIMKEKQRVKEENRKKLEAARKKLNNLKEMNTDIQNDTQNLVQYAEENLDNAIKMLDTRLKRVNSELTAKREEISTLTDLIDLIRMELGEQAMLERDLLDNLELKKHEIEEKDLKIKFSKIERIIDESDYRRLDNEKKGLLRRQDDITAKRGELFGQQSELKSQIKRVTDELNEPRYKNAIKNYRTACYEGEVIKQAISDLTKYRTALELALLKHHAEHMERINELIREFWRDIYRGNDVDYVQIRTDEMASGDRRKNYNYRVVQCKNGTEIDMRGRCSAGQRVLASIIIRMALAETFSSNCGVLALDEPTTNLDKDNIESLCMALRKIIEARKTQHNFMLLVITHDEDFVRSLGNIEV